MHKKGIVFGPWVGEFGWEMFSWQAYCRSIARRYDMSIAISRPQNEYLYRDFCDLFLPFSPPDAGVSDSHMNSACTSFDVKAFLQTTVDPEILSGYNWGWVQPQKIGNPPYTHWAQSVNVSGHDVVPAYRLFGKESSCRQSEIYDIVVHARNRSIRPEDNWQEEKWNELVKQLSLKYSVASIGSKTASRHIENSTDLRGVSTEVTAGVLSRAMCIIGPSSGPIHFATLCGCPQITWTNHQPQNFSKSRYLYTWNPFGVNVLMLEDKNPSVKSVLEAIESL